MSLSRQTASPSSRNSAQAMEEGTASCFSCKKFRDVDVTPDRAIPDFHYRGYHGVANYMGLNESRFAIVRRFGDLNMLNIMSLQAELMMLSLELRETCEIHAKEFESTEGAARAAEIVGRKNLSSNPPQTGDSIQDHGPVPSPILSSPSGEPKPPNLMQESPQPDLTHLYSNFPSLKYPYSFEALRYSESEEAKNKLEIRPEQWELLKKIRQKLKEYNEALIQVSQVQRLDRPTERDFNELWKVLKDLKDRAHSVCPQTFLFGSEGSAWENRYDLVSINPLPKRDFLELGVAYIRGKIKSRQHSNDGYPDFSSKESEERQEAEKSLLRIGHAAVMLAASLIPSIAVLVLYYIKSVEKRIFVLMGLTVAFATVTRLLTTAKKIEIFSATGAFVAVLVVFVGSPATT